MRKSIIGTLSSALLLAGCGGNTDLSEGLSDCHEPSLSEMSLAAPLDGIELRSVCSLGAGQAPTGSAAATWGTSCSSTTCKDEALASDSGMLGWHAASQLTCDYHLIGMKDGGLAVNVTSNAELSKMFGPIDSVAEVEVIATLNHLGCNKVGNKDGALYVLGSDVIAECPVQMQDVLYRVDTDGSTREVERGKITQEGACAGRRPAGLSPRHAAVAGSELGDFLARSAELEAASVVAFQILAAELSAHGAPAELIERTRQAAADEVDHARLMQGLAERFGGEVSPRSVRVGRTRDLETIALENTIEGCVVETWGCLLGMHQASHAEPDLRRAYRRIAADEARHAQLSWDIAAWAEGQLDADALARIAVRRAQAVSELGSLLRKGSDPSDAERVLGLPDVGTQRRLFQHLQASLWS